MRRIGLFISAILLATVGIAFAQQTQDNRLKAGQAAESAAAPIPAADAAKKNPIKPTPEGLAEARKLYGYHCAMCHGKEGNGKGDLAEQMKLDLKDWRDSSSISKYTDGELFYIITNGRGKMVGGEGDRTKDEMRCGAFFRPQNLGTDSQVVSQVGGQRVD
jgi:mono/diheme cytochrome c family protein